MPTRADGVGSVIHEVAERGSALARLEAELVMLELRGKLSWSRAGFGATMRYFARRGRERR